MVSVLALAACYDGAEFREDPGDGIGDAGLTDSGDGGTGDSGGGGEDGGGSGGSGTTSGTTGGGDSGTTGGDSGTTGGDSGTTGGDGDGDTTGEPPPPPDPEDGVYARNIRLTELEMTQGVKIDLTDGNGGGTLIAGSARNARIIQDRPGLLRAYWSVESGFTQRAIEARLVLEVPGQANPKIYSHEITLASNSQPANTAFNGTFRWEIPAEDMKSGTRFSVAFYEVDDSMSGTPGPAVPPRIPADGTVDLGIDPGDYRMDVVLVPITWTAGGTTTNLSQADVDYIQQQLYLQNPVSEVSIRVRQNPMTWSSGSLSMSALLDAVQQERNADNPPFETYYAGVGDFNCFAINGSSCSNGGGTTGIAYVGSANWASGRSSMNIWFQRESSTGTIVHEVGHNQGLQHAPCNVSGDPAYPYSQASIGVQGYNLDEREFYPNTFRDYMSYCSNNWVSDWTWEKTADRAGALTSDYVPPPNGTVLRGFINEETGEEIWTVLHEDLDPAELDMDLRVELRSGDVVDELPGTEGMLSDDVTRVVMVQLPEGVEDATDLTAGYDVMELVDYGERHEIKLGAHTQLR